MNVELKGAVCLVANTDIQPGTRSERFIRAWISVRKLWEMVNPDIGPFLDSDICPSCRQVGFLVKADNDVWRCWRCGGLFIPGACVSPDATP